MSKVLIPLIVLLLAAFMIYRTWTNSKAGEENFQQGQAFLLENAKKEGIITTESGLQYEVLETSGNTEKPGPKSKVKVHYHGTLIDGTVFDSSVDRGTPISFGLNQVIKGWQEGFNTCLKVTNIACTSQVHWVTARKAQVLSLRQRY